MAIQLKDDMVSFDDDLSSQKRRSRSRFGRVFTLFSILSTIAIFGVLYLILSEVSGRFSSSHGDHPPPPQSTVPATKTLKYGPFIVPNMKVKNGMVDFFIPEAKIPCQDCFITAIHAGLEYPNGSYANANTSLWLHHVVLYNFNLPDTVCADASQGGDAMPQRWFASGNERTAFDFSENGITNAGYYIGPRDVIAFSAELMNQAMFDQSAVVTIQFSYTPSSPATKDFQHITPIWLDIGGCENSEMAAFADTTFNYTSSVWKSTVEGKILQAGGHLHDGGTNFKILNGGVTMGDCELEARYGQTPGFIDGPNSMEMGSISGGGEMQYKGMHVSSISMCEGMEIKKGDALSVQAFYDTRKYAPMMDGDRLEDIMGISIIYVV